jgi:hypothetical protein
LIEPKKSVTLASLKRREEGQSMKAIAFAVFLFAFCCTALGFQSGSGQSSNSPTSVAPADKASPPPQAADGSKKKKLPRIGVAQVNSIATPSLATDGWQQELVDDIDFLGGQGVILNGDPNDREGTMAEAKDRNCDYLIFTTVTNFKSVGVGEKLGNVLGRGGLGGVGGAGQGRVELSAEVKVFQPDNVVPVFDGNEDFRQNDAGATARGLMHTEAREVMLQVKKLQSTSSEVSPKTSNSPH